MAAVASMAWRILLPFLSKILTLFGAFLAGRKYGVSQGRSDVAEMLRRKTDALKRSDAVDVDEWARREGRYHDG